MSDREDLKRRAHEALLFIGKYLPPNVYPQAQIECYIKHLEANQNQPNWISVKERLPDLIGDQVIVVIRKTREYWEDVEVKRNERRQIRKIDCLTEICLRYPSRDWQDEGITHWMLLPEPPTPAGD